MSAKIIPLGSYQRIQDIRYSRSMREAWGHNVALDERIKVPMSWLEMAGIALLTASGFLVAMIAISLWR